jgi:hypothetical protein
MTGKIRIANRIVFAVEASSSPVDSVSELGSIVPSSFAEWLAQDTPTIAPVFQPAVQNSSGLPGTGWRWMN